jgi:hypothetical protein
MALSLCAMVVFGVQYWNIQQMYSEGDESYHALIGRVRPGGVQAEAAQTYRAGGEHDERAANGTGGFDAATNSVSLEQATAGALAGGSTAAGENIGQTAEKSTNDRMSVENDQLASANSLSGPVISNVPDNTVHSPRQTIMIPELSIDFAALQAINADAVAWLYGPGTVIDYPVLPAPSAGRHKKRQRHAVHRL